MKIRSKAVLIIFLIFIFSRETFGAAVIKNMVITGDTTWDGEIIIQGGITVERNAVLTVLPGTIMKFITLGGALNIRGALKAIGTNDKKITFTSTDENNSSDKWDGITFNGDGAGGMFSHLTNCIIKSAVAGIKYNMGAKGKIENCFFSKNNRGVYLSQKSEVTIINTDFTENNDAGIYCERSYSKIINNHFYNNKNCGLILFGGGDNIVDGNFIEKNNYGLIASQIGTSADVKNNIIQGNGTGILVERWAGLEILRNTLRENDIGIWLKIGGKSQITFNEIVRNKIGILNTENFSLSASENNIYENTEYDISLKNVSSDYNKKNKIKNSQDEPKIPVFVRGEIANISEEYLKEYFDAHGNFWGEEITKEMNAKGESGNITKFFDFYDNPFVEVEGVQYKSDYVLYKEWRDKPVEGAGAVLKSFYGADKINDNGNEEDWDSIQLNKGVFPKGLEQNTDPKIENRRQNQKDTATITVQPASSDSQK